MLIGLAAPLDEGMRIPVSLFFERAGMIEATFEVGSVGAKGPRPEIAAASQASAARTPALKSDTDEPFFTHICGTRVMANVTVSPGKRGPVEVLVVHHSGFDVLIPSHSRMGKFSGGKRISMLRGTPGWRRIKPFRSRVTIIWWTDGGLTRKWRWMSASAGGCPNM